MRARSLALRLAAMLACLTATPAVADSRLKRDVEPPSYAVIEPEDSNLNIDSVVLACEEAGDARIVQLQIYLSTGGPCCPGGQAATTQGGPACRDRDRRPSLSGRSPICRCLRGAG
jgi:hypothetical protein